MTPNKPPASIATAGPGDDEVQPCVKCGHPNEAHTAMLNEHSTYQGWNRCHATIHGDGFSYPCDCRISKWTKRDD